MKQFIFWASYLYTPALLAFILIAIRKSGNARWLAILAITLSSVLAYARFVEPRLLVTKHAEIRLHGAVETSDEIKIALFSDTHFGIYKNAMPMRRIVERVNSETPDVVLIAGDFLYHLPPDDIPNALAALSSLEAPVFAVLGNHDVGRPGPVYTSDLYAALRALDVTLVENRAEIVTLSGRDVIIGGTSDLWQRRQDFAFSVSLPDLPTLLLTHNPDTAYNIPADLDYDLMLAGHTHGGQIRLPGLINAVIPTQYPFDKGLHQPVINGEPRQVYVTTGTGMVGLPMRFNMPPRIDILTLALPPGQ